jgi:hypothetical protein
MSTPPWDGIPTMLYVLCILLYAGKILCHVKQFIFHIMP